MAAFGQSSCLNETKKKEVVTKYFSSNYKEARKKFLDASNSVGATIESFLSPNIGPEGGPLFTDVVLIGPADSKAFLVVISGTHGVEGFAGSGIQTGLLSEGIKFCLQTGMSIVMIHALNPYGFSHLRRVNEENIDLNRNFVDHAKPYPKNLGYNQLADAIAPTSLSYSATIASLFRFMWYWVLNSKAELQTAITSGQYSHPHGLFYGGSSQTWSNKTLQEIVKRYLSTAERIVVIGIHTGLGSYGESEIILNESKGSHQYLRAEKWWGSSKTVSTLSGKSVSAHLSGTLKLALPRMLPNTEVTAVSLEFGTVPLLKIFKALREENWLYHYGDKNHPDATKIKQELLRAFYPGTDDWKHLVWIQGKEVIENAIIGLLSEESQLLLIQDQ